MSEVSVTIGDEDLVRQFKKGEQKAFDELYLRYASRLKRLIMYSLGDADESEDVLHDVFMRVFLHIDSFNTDMAFSSWIYRIAVNCCKNYRKKRMKEKSTVGGDQMDGINSPEGSPEELYIREEDMREFYLAVDSLKEKFKTVFLLRFDHGMQYSQISNVLDCPERTAKWRMQKAVEKIADRLKSRNVV
ncbi:MAG: RNA polymerase sigma factor [Spirochaetales bacterium]|nr:MAG: RNA polymerase sigma factor [Spirochaetales bacterium]